MLTCTVFDMRSIQCSSRTGIGIGIGYWHWDRPVLLGIGCLVWYRSNPSYVPCADIAATVCIEHWITVGTSRLGLLELSIH